jgi:hypothetical protein
MSKGMLKPLMVPAFSLLVLLLPPLLVDEAMLQVNSTLLQHTIEIGHYVIGICVWLTLAWLIIRVIEGLVWPLFIERRLGRPTPRFLKDFVRFLVMVIAVGAIISKVFENGILQK